MPNIPEEVIKALRDDWTEAVGAGKVPDKKAVQKIFDKLLGEVLAGQDFPLTKMGLKGALVAFQTTFLSSVATNMLGVLTDRLGGIILSTLTADDSDESKTTETQDEPVSTASDRAFWIRYRIDDNFPSSIGGSSTKGLIKVAWLVWTRPTKHLLVRDFTDVANAQGVLTVTNKSVAQGAGLAPVLGPGKFDIDAEIKLDVAEIVDSPDAAKTFANVAAHEFGHIIGFDHDPNPASIMHPVVTGGATESDFNKAKAIYAGFEDVADPEIPPDVDPEILTMFSLFPRS